MWLGTVPEDRWIGYVQSAWPDSKLLPLPRMVKHLKGDGLLNVDCWHLAYSLSRLATRPLVGVKRTPCIRDLRSANDPKQTQQSRSLPCIASERAGVANP